MMIYLLAHHVELHHIPVLMAFFASGIWIGWRMTDRLLGGNVAS